jgi:choline transport protein
MLTHLTTQLTNNSLPTNAIFTTLAITVILSLIVLASAIALQALTSLLVAALFSSYILPCALLLWRRRTGQLTPYVADSSSDSGLSWGPWRVPEHIFACLYSILALFWSFWPQTILPTPATTNWSILVSRPLFCSVLCGTLSVQVNISKDPSRKSERRQCSVK